MPRVKLLLILWTRQSPALAISLRCCEGCRQIGTACQSHRSLAQTADHGMAEHPKLTVVGVEQIEL